MERLERSRSKRLDRERLALEQQVEAEFQQQQQQLLDIGDVAEMEPRVRRGSSSVYLPAGNDSLKVAKRVLQTIYALYQRYDRQHLIENASFAIAMMGVVLVVLDNEYVDSRTGKLVLRTANAALTALLLVLIVWRFVVVRDILIQRNAVPPNVALHRMPLSKLLQLVCELAVCAVCVPPGLGESTFTVWEWRFYLDSDSGAVCEPPYEADSGSCYIVYNYPVEVLGLLSLLRLYMIPRVIRNMSEFTSYRTSYLGALHRVDTMSSLFAVKCFLHAHPFKFLLAAFVGTLLLTAYALAIIEGPRNPAVAPLGNSLWLVAVTMGTVGYGDVTPETAAGEVLLVIGGMLTGILLVGALSAALFGFLELSERDQRFVQLIFHQESTRRLRNACALSIQAAWKCHRARELVSDDSKRRRALTRYDNLVYHRTAHQRKLRWRHISIDANKTTVSELRDCQEQLLFTLRNEHAATMKRLLQAERRLDALLYSIDAQKHA